MNWLFVDMNAYFASVEQHFRPELRGRPVGVITVESEHTCVIAASYDAKRYGIKVGTRVSDARILCPGIAMLKPDQKFMFRFIMPTSVRGQMRSYTQGVFDRRMGDSIVWQRSEAAAGACLGTGN